MLKEKYYKIGAVGVLVVVVIGAVLVLMPWRFGGKTVEFTIKKGQILGETARVLAEQNLINNRFIFVAYTIFTGQERKFKAGRYLIPPSASIQTLVNMFSRGLSEPEDVAVTIPEGANLADVSLVLSKSGFGQPSDFLKSDFLKKEGYFFPDTYRFSRDAKASDILALMETNFKEKTRDLKFKDLNKTIIIGSILEKEVKTERDMRLVAGIIEKRLSKKMPLEIDATVAYGVCLPKFLNQKYCDVSLANIKDNLKSDSPYNTYKNTSLPIGPISNPGLKAIRAALNPEPSLFLYYLSARDGTTIFSKTASEHQKVRQKYLQ